MWANESGDMSIFRESFGKASDHSGKAQQLVAASAYVANPNIAVKKIAQREKKYMNKMELFRSLLDSADTNQTGFSRKVQTLQLGFSPEQPSSAGLISSAGGNKCPNPTPHEALREIGTAQSNYSEYEEAFDEG